MRHWQVCATSALKCWRGGHQASPNASLILRSSLLHLSSRFRRDADAVSQRSLKGRLFFFPQERARRSTIRREAPRGIRDDQVAHHTYELIILKTKSHSLPALRAVLAARPHWPSHAQV